MGYQRMTILNYANNGNVLTANDMYNSGWSYGYDTLNRLDYGVSNGATYPYQCWGYDAFGNLNVINDLWEFNPTSKQWTWMSGNNMVNESGTYGMQGIAAATNIPGARAAFASSADSSGNLWVFGGGGYDANGTYVYLNDLWRYQP